VNATTSASQRTARKTGDGHAPFNKCQINAKLAQPVVASTSGMSKAFHLSMTLFSDFGATICVFTIF
jgi:hypothetical protein